jgi:hypothetical protein
MENIQNAQTTLQQSAVPAASSSAIVGGFSPNSAEMGQITSTWLPAGSNLQPDWDAQAVGKTPSEEG